MTEINFRNCFAIKVQNIFVALWLYEVHNIKFLDVFSNDGTTKNLTFLYENRADIRRKINDYYQSI